MGWVASLVMKTEQSLIWDIIVGMLGAVVGGFIMTLLGESDVNGFNLYSFIVALIGACVLIAVVRAIRK